MKRYLRLACTLTLFLTGIPQAETWLKYEARPEESKVQIEGTSTLHDWKVEGNAIHGSLEFQTHSLVDSLFKGLSGWASQQVDAAVQVEIPIRLLKSGKEGMDKKMYKALKEKDHPKIQYRLTGALLKAPQDMTVHFDTTGELIVAGVSRPIEMVVYVERLQERRLRITGETSLKMKDFEIKPPRAMMGMIRTGNKVKVAFDWITELPVESKDGIGVLNKSPKPWKGP